MMLTNEQHKATLEDLLSDFSAEELDQVARQGAHLRENGQHWSTQNRERSRKVLPPQANAYNRLT